MKYYIPTKGRSKRKYQRAYAQLEEAGLDPILVVDESEDADYSRYRHVRVPVTYISQKRRAIQELAGKNKFAQIDDDIELHSVRIVDGKCIIRYPTSKFLRRELDRAEQLLDDYVHGGVHTRHFVNFAKKPFVLNRGYYRQVIFLNPSLRGPLPKYPDTDSTGQDVNHMLKILEKGEDYFLLTNLCMVEKEPQGHPETWRQSRKNKDMRRIGKRYSKFIMPTKDGRITLRYSAILKAAKKGELWAE